MSTFLKKHTSSIFSIIGIFVIVTLVYIYELNSQYVSSLNVIQSLSDGFFITAVLYLCLGAFISIADSGGFNGLRYLTYSITTIFIPGSRNLDERKNYFEYIRNFSDAGKKNHTELWITGCFCLIISFLLSSL